MNDDEVIHSMFPTAVIDLHQGIVKQTHPFHEYSVLRKEFLSLEVEKLISSKKRENLWTAQYISVYYRLIYI